MTPQEFDDCLDAMDEKEKSIMDTSRTEYFATLLLFGLACHLIGSML